MPGKPCEEPGGCIHGVKNAKFGYPDKKDMTRLCAKHAKPGMEDLYRKKCQCKPPLKKKVPYFGYKGKLATHCDVCKLPDMINVVSKKCIMCKIRIPSYGKKGIKKATHCAQCIKKYKLKGYVDVTHKKCAKHGKIARYGFKGKSATHCFRCKLPNMFNLQAKYCIKCLMDRKIKIPTRAGYGVGKKPTHCFRHKTKKMKDVISKRCEHKGCNEIQPKYNIPGETSGKFCFNHKKVNMINVKAYYCQYEDCPTQACFNTEGEKLGKYCIEHIEDGMVDVVHTKCVADGCNTVATFGFEFADWVFCCAKHTDGDEDIVDLIHSKCPHIMPDGKICNIRAHYNTIGSTVGKYCSSHKEKGMIIIGNKMCKNDCGAQTHNELYQGYCYQCYVVIFPDSPVSISYLTKEKNVCSYVATKLVNETQNVKDLIIDVTYNKIIEGGSSKRRPDLFIKKNSNCVMTEIDEHRHTVYDNEDDMIRISQLWNDIGKKPLVIIRFNPDSYINKDGKRILTPWQKTIKGTQLKPDMIDDWNKRLKKLYKCINYWILNKPKKMITIIYLYYDADHVQIETYDNL
jgi:hypothetical protein